MGYESDEKGEIKIMVLNQQKILVIKHGAFGDIIQGIDAFASLRVAYPKAQIDLLTTNAFKRFFHNCPWFDNILIDPRAPAWRLDSHYKMRQIFISDWDKVIDLQCSQRTRRYHDWFFKEKNHDGSAKRKWFGDAKECSHPIPDFTGVNNRDRMLHTVGMAKATLKKGALDWLLAQSNFALPAKNYCILIPGCSAAKPSKRWPADKFIELAKYALQDGILPLLIGTSVDAEAIGAVSKAVPKAVNLMGKTSFADLAKLAASSHFTVGNDTGPVFLAARCGKPTIMVMGRDTDPTMSAPVGDKATYIQDAIIADVQPETVFAKYKSLER